jgi:predicted nucleotidyltransferase component of viral defense system
MNAQDILTPLQENCLKVLFDDEWFRRHFYLTGGTALSAYYLQHRYSEDLDFFSHGVELQSIPTLMKTLEKALNRSVKATQSSPSFRRYLVDGKLQIDFVGDVDFRIGSPELVDQFMIDSLQNIAVNKVCCILGRTDPKDFVDLYFLINEKKFDIFELLNLAKKKDGGMDEFVWTQLIAEADNIQALPRMIKKLDVKRMKSFFNNLRNQILNNIRPL